MSIAGRLIRRFNESIINEASTEFWKDLYASDNSSLRNRFSGKENVVRALNLYNIDIEKSNFEPIKITSPRDPRWKKPGILILVGSKGAVVVKDGKLISENQTLETDPTHSYNSSYDISWKSSYKKIIDSGVHVWFIPEENYILNTELRNKRYDSKAGDVNFLRKKFAQRYNPAYNRWQSKEGYDKSGYKLDPDKYRRKLSQITYSDGNWKSLVSKAIDKYEEYIEIAKSIPRNLSALSGTGSLPKSKSIYFSLGTAMSHISDLGSSIENVIKAAEELDNSSAKYVRVNFEFRIDDLRNDLNICRRYFSQFLNQNN